MTAVGIDVGKAALDVAMQAKPGAVQIASSAAGMRKLIRLVAKLDQAALWWRRQAATRRSAPASAGAKPGAAKHLASGQRRN